MSGSVKKKIVCLCGWQNSHLRQFELPENRFRAVTNDSISMWRKLVGVLFRSPLMDENDIFWADDYNGGSFKNWLRKKIYRSVYFPVPR